jgi:hypothetical protein
MRVLFKERLRKRGLRLSVVAILRCSGTWILLAEVLRAHWLLELNLGLVFGSFLMLLLLRVLR